MPKKDNAGIAEKLALRERALRFVAGDLVVLEAYAGAGEIGRRLYLAASEGVAFEKDEVKSGQLAMQRPQWRVYQGDSVAALRSGIARDCAFSFVDLDPYGDPWPATGALLGSGRKLAATLVVAVNDGLPQLAKLGGSWRAESLSDATLHFGCDLYDRYLQVARWIMEKKAADAGYRVDRFEGKMGGHAKQMAHYFAVLKRRDEAPPPCGPNG